MIFWRHLSLLFPFIRYIFVFFFPRPLMTHDLHTQPAWLCMLAFMIPTLRLRGWGIAFLLFIGRRCIATLP